MFTTSVHSDSAFRKDELAAGRTLISIVVLNLANRVYLIFGVKSQFFVQTVFGKRLHGNALPTLSNMYGTVFV